MNAMKIEFVTDDNPLYVLPFFDEFFRHFDGEFEIQRISICRPMGKRSRAKLLREMVTLYGPIGLGRIGTRIVFAKILGTFPRDKTSTKFFAISQICKAFGIPFENIGNPNADAFVEGMRLRKPDVLVSVACPYILKKGILQIPKLGCINIHHAPLPRYKGMMPTFWQMFHGEKKVGLTIHYMVEKIDEGQALLQAEMPIEPNESLDKLIQRAKRFGAHCMATVLRQMRTQTQVPISLSAKDGSYFTFPTLREIREFRKKGLKPL